MHAWATDIDQYLSRERGGVAVASHEGYLPLISMSPLLKKFDEDIDDGQRILSGAKGTGKSTALARKAAKYSKTPNYSVIPSYHPFTVSLSDQSIDVNSLSKGEIFHYTSHYSWVNIWTLSIGIAFLYYLHFSEIKKEKSFSGFLIKKLPSKSEKNLAIMDFFDDINEDLSSIKETQRRDLISPIIKAIVRRKWDSDQCSKLYSKYICRNFSMEKSKDTYAVFIDSIDEAFKRNLKITLDEEGESAATVWHAAQTSIIDASTVLEKDTNGLLRVYASIRIEAKREYGNIGGAKSDSQLKESVLVLSYSNEELKEIFKNNIIRTNKKYLAKPKSHDIIERFFGSKDYKHKYVDKKECPVDWVMRHTFQNPRDVVLHGRNICFGLNKDFRSDREKLSEIINRTAIELYHDYIRQMVSPWRSGVEKIFKHLKHAIIDKKVAICIDNSWKTAVNDSQKKNAELLHDPKKLHKHIISKPLTYLYQLGFIGYPNGHNRIEFRSLTMNDYWPELPDKPYYITHPCLTEIILNRVNISKKKYHTNQFVVGAGLKCPGKVVFPKYFILMDKIKNASAVAYVPDNESFTLDSDILNRNIIDELVCGLPGKRGNVGPFLILAILSAMSRKNKSTVTSDDVVAEAHLGVERMVLPVLIGATKRGAKPLTPPTYLLENFKKGSDTHLIKVSKKIAKTTGWELKANEANSVIVSFTLNGVHPNIISREYIDL